MPRKYDSTERFLKPDPRYDSRLVSKFINCQMRNGKKGAAEKILYGALDLISQREEEAKPLEVFHAAIENVKPAVEVRSRRVGGSTYQVPMEVRSLRSQSLSIRWLIQYANARSGRSMRAKLADELMDAFNSRGTSVKKREDIFKMAEANKAFAHYRW